MIVKRYLWVLFSLFVLSGCENLEDTYSDYAGDGEIRYLGHCSSVSLTPGWEKLNLTWKNSVDPMIDKIKITWTLEAKTEEVLLAPTITKYSIPNLKNATYEVTVCGVDNEKNTSLVTTLYGRPYTENHEAVQSFPQLVSKHFFVKDRLVLFFSDWDSRMESAHVAYTKADGGEGILELDSTLVTDKKYYLLEDKIKPDAPVTLERMGYLDNIDLITLAPIELSHASVFSIDFKGLFRMKFGMEEIADKQLTSIEELEIDYSVNSFEDILYLPSIKKLILGKNRYLNSTYLADNKNASVLYNDMARSLFVLDVANEVLGLEVVQYNEHFLPKGKLDYQISKENPMLPSYDYLPMEKWEVTCSPADGENFDSHLEWLFDRNYDTWWQPDQLSVWREHSILINMKELLTLRGVQIVQKAFTKFDNLSKASTPLMVKIQTSENGVSWENATYVEENTIGNTSGEITMIHFPEPREAVFIKFIFNDQVYSNNFVISVADIGVF